MINRIRPDLNPQINQGCLVNGLLQHALDPGRSNIFEQDAEVSPGSGLGRREGMDDDIALANDNILVAFDGDILADRLRHRCLLMGIADRVATR
jgi:hypothetical protein